MMKNTGLFLALAVLCPGAVAAEAQNGPTTAGSGRVRIYLDCSDNCFEDYLRDEIRWVDFVREPQVAEVHVFISTQDTGGGGEEYALRFVGSGRFQGTEDTLRASSAPGEPEDRQRLRVRDTLTVGLLRYVARVGLPPDLELSVETQDAPDTAQPTSDPWNLWVFSLSGSASLEAEESQRQSSWDAGLSIDRVDEQWRVSIGLEVEQQKERFDLDEDDPFSTTSKERSLNWVVVKSLGEHWSTGFRGSLESSTFGNIARSFDAAPAIEFNFFPYSVYNRRQLRMEYSIGARHARYNEVTLFGKLSEGLPEHRFATTLDQRERWGELEAGIEWSQFLNDRSKNRLEGNGEVSLRVARGLSIDLEGSVSRIRDQISLPRRDATPEEVLRELRELRSSYEVSLEIGLTYTFGSIFNNIVNPRFGE
jgi:hypothetical protein